MHIRYIRHTLFQYAYAVAFFYSFLFISCNTKKNHDNEIPSPDRFQRVIIKEDLYMPTELEVADDGIVYFIEANGKFRSVNPTTKQSKLLGTIKNYDNGERGLIGMALDPDFINSHWVYFQYFLPSVAKPIAQISRFTIVNDTIDNASEKKYVQIPYEDACCHTGGSLSFDSKGNLYFSMGDNVNAFETTYSPHDERPGHEIANGMRSAANSMDLRGKICRIHPEKDGSFTIPAGNLFADGKNGRPEVYIMGCRNPYRIFADKKTDILYWGEVGPDAIKDSSVGPQGYDEFNIATKAGNYGWPLFIGNNIPYSHVDFDKKTILEKFNPDKPVNDSRLNAGSKELPPANAATIYYPYVKSSEFPGFGEGGRCAIGGPIYHFNPELKSGINFPAYFDNAWIIGDWMRNWVKCVQLDEAHKVKAIYDLMPSQIFNKPVDMAFSPADGALYMLEFGNTWGPNSEGRLVRIEYVGGNRKPIATLSADKESGSVPLKVNLSAKKSIDSDHDPLTYSWSIDGQKTSEKDADLNYSFNTAGIHTVQLVISDKDGLTDSAKIEIKAGNTKPEISFQLNNHSFYWDSLQYEVLVSDHEDGEFGKGINPDSVKVNLIYVPRLNGLENNNGKLGFRGEVLLNENDCKSCHNMKETTLGPALIAISQRYGEKAIADKTIIDKLAHKIITGGTGAWGNLQMSAHPRLDQTKAAEIVKYILSLAGNKPDSIKIAIKGNCKLENKSKQRSKGFYILEASYADKGSEFITSLSGNAKEVLRSSTLYPEDFDIFSDMKIENNSLAGTNEAYVVLKQVDLSGIKTALIRGSGNGGYVELLIDSLKGEPIGRFGIGKDVKEINSILPVKKGKHDIYLRYINMENRFTNVNIEWIRFK